jgi:hypothetical protein
MVGEPLGFMAERFFSGKESNNLNLKEHREGGCWIFLNW